jgi:hypothetical protein
MGKNYVRNTFCRFLGILLTTQCISAVCFADFFNDAPLQNNPSEVAAKYIEWRHSLSNKDARDYFKVLDHDRPDLPHLRALALKFVRVMPFLFREYDNSVSELENLPMDSIEHRPVPGEIYRALLEAGLFILGPETDAIWQDLGKWVACKLSVYEYNFNRNYPLHADLAYLIVATSPGSIGGPSLWSYLNNEKLRSALGEGIKGKTASYQLLKLLVGS